MPNGDPMLRTFAFAAVLAATSRALAVSCTVGSGGFAFGTYDSLSATPLDSTALLSWSCDASTSLSVDLGRGSSSTYLPRRLTSGPNGADYNLYLDASCSVIWGDGTEGTSTWTGSGTGGSIPVYGRVPARQPLPAGSYADAVVITISF